MDPATLNLTTQVIGYQQYYFLGAAAGARPAAAFERVTEGLVALHDKSGHPTDAEKTCGCYQWLRAEPGASSVRDLPHPGVTNARALLRIESARDDVVLKADAEMQRVAAEHGMTLEIVGGVQRPRSYTSHAMAQYAYAPALAPRPAAEHPFGVVTPMNKTPDWWAMDWIKRESFFLPRYDAHDEMIVKGHTLASAAAIPTVVRRLVHAPGRYGQPGRYDFVGYFEFSAANAPVFSKVMAALRDPIQNPEWKYVREGPEWWGRRVASAAQALG